MQKEHHVPEWIVITCEWFTFSAAGDSSKQSAGDIDDDDDVPGEWW